MDLAEYRSFTTRLREGLEADERVLALVALGSMAEQRRLPDEWSDHDFFVVTAPGEQEHFRTDLAWLPDVDDVVLTIRETAHGLKVLYRDGHLLEFAVFDPDELAVARVNDHRVLFERVPLGPALERISTRPAHSPDPHRDTAMVLALLLVGVGRHVRGERLSGHAFVRHHALHHLLTLLLATAQPEPLPPPDDLDPFRRFETALPEPAVAIDAALVLPLPDAAAALLDVLDTWVRPHLPGYPDAAAQVVAEAISRARG